MASTSLGSHRWLTGGRSIGMQTVASSSSMAAP
jgi:hypothetical protein